MSILTGKEIQVRVADGSIRVEPFEPQNCGPNSLDLRLHKDLMVYKNVIGMVPAFKGPVTGDPDGPLLDMREDNPTVTLEIPEEGLVLMPGILYLARTVELLGSDHYVPIVEGRSSVGRLGIQVHVTAGFCDLGFYGSVTLEMTVVHPVRVYPGERVCQVYWTQPVGEIELYQGRYQGQVAPTSSKMFLGDLNLDK